MAIKSKRQTFNDGAVEIFSVGNAAAPGDRPKEGLRFKVRLAMDRRTVGFKRYFAAAQEQTEITELVRVPFRPDVSTQDVCRIVGSTAQYRIAQVQHPADTLPRCMDLSLERLEKNYEVVAADDN